MTDYTSTGWTGQTLAVARLALKDIERDILDFLRNAPTGTDVPQHFQTAWARMTQTVSDAYEADVRAWDALPTASATPPAGGRDRDR